MTAQTDKAQSSTAPAPTVLDALACPGSIASDSSVRTPLTRDFCVCLAEEHIKQTVVMLYLMFFDQASKADSYDVFFLAQHAVLKSFGSIKDLLGDTVPASLIDFIEDHEDAVETHQFSEPFRPLDFFLNFLDLFAYFTLSAVFFTIETPTSVFIGTALFIYAFDVFLKPFCYDFLPFLKFTVSMAVDSFSRFRRCLGA